MVVFKIYFHILIPEICECDYFRIWLFYVIKLRVSRWDCPGLSGWTLNPITSVFVTKESLTERRGRNNVTKETETKVKYPQAQECWNHQKLEESRDGISPRFSGGNTTLLTHLEKKKNDLDTFVCVDWLLSWILTIGICLFFFPLMVRLGICILGRKTREIEFDFHHCVKSIHC